MQFNSYGFMIFFPIVVGLFFIIPAKLRKLWITVASLCFVAIASVKYMAVLVAVILLSYGLALFMDKIKDAKRKKLFLWGAILMSMSFLLVTKYIGFIFDIPAGILNFFFGTSLKCPFNPLIPLGISYYSMQVVGYIIDVYQGRVSAEKNLLNYAAYISFFPKLIIGPIEKSDFLKQVKVIEHKNLWNWTRVTQGATLLLWGYFQKMVLADNLSPFVTKVYADYASLGSVELFIAMELSILQLIFDFSAGSDMAIGMARIMGFDLRENFEAPFFATTMKEFWTRWHMSLSHWLRDYVYIPLGGNRKGKVRKYINILITFAVSGLWHEASFKFILWGLVNGMYQVVGELWGPFWNGINAKLNTKKESASYLGFQHFRTYTLYALVMLLFFLPSIKDTGMYLYRMCTRHNPWALFDGSLFEFGVDAKTAFVLFVLSVIYIWLEKIKYHTGERLPELLAKQCIWFRWMVLLGLFVGIVVFGAYGRSLMAGNFVYFAF